jgi:hypothetical protein
MKPPPPRFAFCGSVGKNAVAEGEEGFSLQLLVLLVALL